MSEVKNSEFAVPDKARRKRLKVYEDTELEVLLKICTKYKKNLHLSDS